MKQVLLTIFFLFWALTSHSSVLAETQDGDLPEPYGKGKYIAGKHGEIYYESNGQGIPIVFVNGGPGASRTVFWGAFDFLIKQGFQIVYFDETGVGRATRQIDGKHSPLNTVDDLETLRQHLGVDTFILAGHSYGGIPVVQYALKYSQHVDKVIMLSASADAISQQMNVDSARYLRKTFYPELWEKLEAMRADGVLSSDMNYLNAFYTEAIDNRSDWYLSENSKTLRRFYSSDPRDGFNLDVYFDVAGNDPEVQISGTLKGINVTPSLLKHYSIPTLILNGRFDWKTTPEMAYRFYKMLPEGTAKLVFLEKTGHWPWAEEPQLFEQTLKRFLAHH